MNLPDDRLLFDLSQWWHPGHRQHLLDHRRRLRDELGPTASARPEVAWNRRAPIQTFFFPYDPNVYDAAGGGYRTEAFLDEGLREFGGYDQLVLWQPYPRMGIDSRNQLDFWQDLPGGTAAVRKNVVEPARARGVSCLVNYIPWDHGSARTAEGDARPMADLVAELGADGLYGDTMPGMERPFADALAAQGSGLILESEHNPPLAFLRWQQSMWSQDTKPAPLAPLVHHWADAGTMIRIVERTATDRSRLIALSLFFGHGFVVWENVFGWWNPMNAADRARLRRVAPLLRDYADVFADRDWVPLERRLVPGVYGNRFSDGDRTLVTLLNTNEHAVDAARVPVGAVDGRRVFDLYHASELQPTLARVSGEDAEVVTRLEPGGCGCVLVQGRDQAAPTFAPQTQGLSKRRDRKHRGRVVAGNANFEEPLLVVDTPWRRPVTPEMCLPRPAPQAPPHPADDTDPQGMARVPAGRFVMLVEHLGKHDEGSCYGDPVEYGYEHPPQLFWMGEVLIDRTEVTNAHYHAFLQATGYRPADLARFLDHWDKPDADAPRTWHPPEPLGDHPVVWVDLDDARAYAAWAGKRLPTEPEWQLAAQGRDGRRWPWGDAFDPDKCNHRTDATTPVDAFPDAASPYGCLDMAGNVWEWTESERHNGHLRYAILRSGSHFVIDGDWQGIGWHTASGAQPANAHQKMLLCGPSLDRCATVGFRCAKPVAD